MHNSFDTHHNPGLRFAKMEVDPIEVLKHLQETRDDLAKRIEQQLEGGLKSIKDVKDGNRNGGFTHSIHSMSRSLESLTEKLEKTEQAIRSIYQSCFETCVDPRKHVDYLRQHLEDDFSLKINPFNKDLSEEVIKGCKVLGDQRYKARMKANREASQKRQAQNDNSRHYMHTGFGDHTAE